MSDGFYLHSLGMELLENTVSNTSIFAWVSFTADICLPRRYHVTNDFFGLHYSGFQVLYHVQNLHVILLPISIPNSLRWVRVVNWLSTISINVNSPHRVHVIVALFWDLQRHEFPHPLLFYFSYKPSTSHMSSHFVFLLLSYFILFYSSSSIHFSFVFIFLLFRFSSAYSRFRFTFPSIYFPLLLFLSYSSYTFHFFLWSSSSILFSSVLSPFTIFLPF